MSRRLTPGKGTGNQEVSRHFILAPRGDLSGAGREAIPKEGARGGTWFPHESDPQGSDA